MEKPRLARLTAIITQLQAKRLVTAREMAGRYGVSIRTIYRDIRTLEQSGIPIFTEEGKGYSLMEGYKLPPVMFTEAEANALITAAQILQKNNDQSLIDEYQSAVEKIKAVLKGSQKDKSALLSERLEVRANPTDAPTSNQLMALQKAITNYELIELDYVAESGKQSQRRIEPFALIHTQGNWVLIAFCRLREDFRAFRLDRIQQLRVLAATFEPHDITLQGYYDKARVQWETQAKNNP